MPEREDDVAIFADAIPDDFSNENRRWYDDIPDMPYPGMGRANADESYSHMLDAFTKSQTDKHQSTPQDIKRIFDADKQRVAPYIKARPDNDYTLKNVLAIGIWHATEEFEKEEGSTPCYQTFKQVNSLIRQTLDLTTPQAPLAPGK